MAEKESKKNLIVLAILGIIAVFVGIYVIQDDSGTSKKTEKEGVSSKQEKQIENIDDEYIAVLSIKGIIEEKNETYDQNWLVNTIDILKDDEKNKAILLNINSPGGGLYEADEVYYGLQKYKNTGKPVWAYLGQTAASGGYYIACAADSIFANKTTLTGSIGVLLGPSIDISELLKTYGIKTTTFTSGKNKNMLSFDNPVTDEQRTIMQSIVDDAYDQFLDVVATGRNISKKTLLPIADGRIFTARQAHENKLIDNIAYFDETIDELQKKLREIENLDEETLYAIEYFEPIKKSDSLAELLENFSFLLKSPATKSEELQLLENIANKKMLSNYTLQL